MANPAAILSVLVRADTGKASAALLRFNTHLGETDKKANKATAALKTLGKGATIGAAAGMAYAVKKAADFEQQLDSLGAVSNASAREMELFRKQAMKAGADTKFSALEAAAAQTELAKGGLRVRQIMKGGLKSALALAAAGEIELADAASTTANAMKLFGLRGRDTMKVADGLATAANRTTADVGDFALALKMGGSVARLAGMNFRDTVVVLEALAEAGIKGSDAGTSLKSFFLNIATPSAKAQRAMDELGLSIFDQQGKLKELPALAKNVRAAFGDLTKEQFLNKAGIIAGSDAVRTLWSLYDAGPDKLGRLQRATEKHGTAVDVAAKKQDNLKGKLENLQGSIETLAISVGQTLIPPLTDAAEKLTGFINQMQTGKGAGGKFASALERIADAVKDIVKFAVDHPVTTTLLTALAGIAKGKGLGLGGMKKVGGIGGVIGGTKPVPVFVTNPGFGGGKGPGGLVGLPGGKGAGGAGTLSKAGKVLRWVPIIGARGNTVGLALTALAVAAENHVLPDNNVGRREGQRRATQTPSGQGANIPGSEGAAARQATREKARIEQSKRLHEAWRKKVAEVTRANSDAYERSGTVQTKVMSKSARDIADLRMKTARETQRIKRRFSEDTDKGREALAKNYRRAAEIARNQMDSAGKVTKSGLAFIRRMMANELRLYGLSEESIRFRLEGKEQSGKTIGAPLVGKQAGGVIVPGSGSGDKVPAMLEPGEVVWNRNAVASLFGSAQNADAVNQMIPRFAKGGIAGMMAAANKLDAAHFPYVWGGGHQGSPAPFGPMDCSGAVSYVLQRGGVKIPTMVSGALAHAGSPGPGRVTVFANPTHTFMRIGSRYFGTSGTNPGGGAGWMPDPGAGYRSGFTQRHFNALGGTPGIKRVKVAGADSPIKSVMQGALDKTRSAARHRLNALSSMVFGGGDVGDSASNLSGNRRIGQNQASRWGWGSGAQWRALDHLWGHDEGSWNENLWNMAGSGAYGIAQALPASKYPRAGQPTAPPGARKARAQIRWGLKYIKGRYGSPIAADAFRHRVGWYKRGGIVGLKKGGKARRSGTIRRLGRPQRNGRSLYGWGGRRDWTTFVGPMIRRGADTLKQGPKVSFDDQIAFGAAMAALTDDQNADDIRIANTAITGYQARLNNALARGDTAAATEAATNLKSWQDTLAQLNDTSQEQNDLLQQQIAAQEAHTQAVNELKDQQKRNEDLIRTQAPSLRAALIQSVNGGIGGNAGLGRQFPSSAGLGGLSRA